GLAASTLSLASTVLYSNPDRAGTLLAEAETQLVNQLKALPNLAEVSKLLATVRANMGILDLTRKDARSAKTHVESAIQLHTEARHAFPHDPQIPPELARDYLLLAMISVELGDPDGARSAAESLAQVTPEDVFGHIQAAAQIARAVQLVKDAQSADASTRDKHVADLTTAAVSHLRETRRLDPKAIGPAALDFPFFAPLKGQAAFEAFRKELSEKKPAAR
ncbi:MAG: hypothetical protein U0835_08875, partial [Isosphaeraceae bacterium]